MSQPLAVLTGASGQDGAYLTEWLVKQGYRVLGTSRADAPPNLSRLQSLGMQDAISFRPLALESFSAVRDFVSEFQPDELYHLAAQSSVARSFEDPLGCCQGDGVTTLNLLEALRTRSPHTKFFHACSAEVFGNSQEESQTEQTPLAPLSPYACVKAYSHYLTSVYRKSYGLFACSGILFNHESPLRPVKFVTQKIVAGLTRLSHSSGPPLELGNLEAVRDWGYAPEYVQGMWKMLQFERPEDFVLATGFSRSVKDFAECVGQACGLDFDWELEDGREIARERRTGRILMQVDSSLRRANDIARSQGNAAKAAALLGWTARTHLPDLVKLLVDHELRRVKMEAP